MDTSYVFKLLRRYKIPSYYLHMKVFNWYLYLRNLRTNERICVRPVTLNNTNMMMNIQIDMNPSQSMQVCDVMFSSEPILRYANRFESIDQRAVSNRTVFFRAEGCRNFSPTAPRSKVQRVLVFVECGD